MKEPGFRLVQCLITRTDTLCFFTIGFGDRKVYCLFQVLRCHYNKDVRMISASLMVIACNICILVMGTRKAGEVFPAEQVNLYARPVMCTIY
jgi:hypothetical protein